MELLNRLGMKDAHSITPNGLRDCQRMTSGLEDPGLMLNAGWNEDLLRKKLFGLKSTKFEMYPLRFDLKEKDDIAVDREIDQLEYDKSAFDDIEMIPCPECGKLFPG